MMVAMGRKPLNAESPTVRVTVRLSEALLARAEVIAARRGETVSELIRRLLEKAR